MNNYLEYKGYYGTVEYSKEDDILHGSVIGVPLHTFVSYEGKTLKELKRDFRIAVDDFLRDNDVAKLQKPCKGSFSVRIGPELHMKAVLKAKAQNKTLNSFVKNAIEKALDA